MVKVCVGAGRQMLCAMRYASIHVLPRSLQVRKAHTFMRKPQRRRFEREGLQIEFVRAWWRC